MGILPIPYVNYENPSWLVSLAATKITGTLTKSQQHAQTAYYDAAGTWAETQLFQKPITVQDGGGNNVFDVVTNQIRFRTASTGYILGPSGQLLAGEDAVGFYYGMGFTTPTKPIYIGQSLTSQILANAQTINNRTSEFNIIGVDGTGWGAFRAGVSTFGTGTAYGQLNVYGGATYIAQDQPINWHSGGTIRSQIIGDSTDNLRFSTRKAGVLTEAFVLAGSGAATFSGNMIVGSGTSSPIVRINGGSTIGIGASLEFQAAGSTIGYVGRASYVSSGGINTSDMAYYAHTGLGHNFIVNGGFSSAFSVTSAGNITATGTAKLGDFTVATLPSAASNTGHECNVTDSSVTTFGATVAGGGSNNVKVRSNGTNWTVTGI